MRLLQAVRCAPSLEKWHHGRALHQQIPNKAQRFPKSSSSSPPPPCDDNTTSFKRDWFSNPKGSLIEFGGQIESIRAGGTDHRPCYEATAQWKGRQYVQRGYTNRKSVEQKACRKVLEMSMDDIAIHDIAVEQKAREKAAEKELLAAKRAAKKAAALIWKNSKRPSDTKIE